MKADRSLYKEYEKKLNEVNKDFLWLKHKMEYYDSISSSFTPMVPLMTESSDMRFQINSIKDRMDEMDRWKKTMEHLCNDLEHCIALYDAAEKVRKSHSKEDQ